VSGIPHAKILAAVALALLAVLIARALTKRDKSDASQLNLDDLLIDPATGKISKAAAVLMGSFALSSWVVIFKTLNSTMTDTLFAAYLATYAAPAVVKIIGDTFGKGQVNGPAQ
jgi:hypothetical protein